MTPQQYLEWLNSEIERSIKNRNEQDYDPEAVAMCQGHIDAYSVARTKFLTIDPNNYPTEEKSFTDGLE
jgi:hypothetical protein